MTTSSWFTMNSREIYEEIQPIFSEDKNPTRGRDGGRQSTEQLTAPTAEFFASRAVTHARVKMHKTTHSRDQQALYTTSYSFFPAFVLPNRSIRSKFSKNVRCVRILKTFIGSIATHRRDGDRLIVKSRLGLHPLLVIGTNTAVNVCHRLTNLWPSSLALSFARPVSEFYTRFDLTQFWRSSDQTTNIFLDFFWKSKIVREYTPVYILERVDSLSEFDLCAIQLWFDRSIVIRRIDASISWIQHPSREMVLEPDQSYRYLYLNGNPLISYSS